MFKTRKKEKPFPFPLDTTHSIPLVKDNTHVLQQPSDVILRAVWIRDIDTVSAQENI
jgi:hypothetical protein